MTLTVTRKHISVLNGDLTRYVPGTNLYFTEKSRDLDQVVAVIGPAGPPGSGAQRFDITTPSANWIVNHTLGRVPTVQIFTVAGELVFSNVNASDTVVSVAFASPMAGFVLLS